MRRARNPHRRSSPRRHTSAVTPSMPCRPPPRLQNRPRAPERTAPIASSAATKKLGKFTQADRHYLEANLRPTGWTGLLKAHGSLVEVLVQAAPSGYTGTSCSRWRSVCGRCGRPSLATAMYKCSGRPTIRWARNRDCQVASDAQRCVDNRSPSRLMRGSPGSHLSPPGRTGTSDLSAAGGGRRLAQT